MPGRPFEPSGLSEGQDPASFPSGWKFGEGKSKSDGIQEADGCVQLGFWVSKKCTECPLSVCKFDDVKQANWELRYLIKKGQVERDGV